MINFSGKILEITKFAENYKKIQVISVQKQLGISLSYNINSIDWNYMLTSASILAQSEDGIGQEASLRIAQTSLTMLNDENKRNAAAIVLHTLTNNTAITLAIKRALLKSDYLSNISLPLRIDVSRRNLEQTVHIKGTDIVTLNKFQKQAYDKFFQTDRLSISAPTSAGKSFLLYKLLIDSIIKNNFRKIVFVVPTRALVQQVESDIKSRLKEDFEMYEVSVMPVFKEVNHPMVYVLTQERLQWLLNDNSEYCPDIIFVDEAQKIGDSSRGIILENVLNEITNRNNKIKMVFASPMTKNPEKLLGYNRLETTKLSKIVGEYTAVNQNLIWLHQEPYKPEQWHIDFCMSDEVLEIGEKIISEATNSKRKIAQVAKNFSVDNQGSLVFVKGKAEAESVARFLFDLEKESEASNEKILDLIELVKSCVHKDYLLATVLERGIAFHYADMPLLIKTEIENLFKEGIIKYIVCTATLIEGVNLPAQSIFIHGIKKGKNTVMSQMDFWNLAGRAGRQGREFQGNIICIDSDDEKLWGGQPPRKKERYEITSTVDLIINKEYFKFCDFILADDMSSLFKNSDYAHALSFFLNEKNKYPDLSKSYLSDEFGLEKIKEIDKKIEKMLEKCSIPIEVLVKNVGIHPMLQRNLMNDFAKNETNNLKKLIPLKPGHDDAYANYENIINKISTFLNGQSSKLSKKYTILVLNWMKGYGLARIISDCITSYRKNHKSKKTDSIIRETMHEIENFVRFQFIKYITCYNNLLSLHFEKSNNSELINSIPKLNLWLEFGASITTQISLMGLGLSRSTALEISGIMANENLSTEECESWLRDSQLKKLGINEIYIKEVKRILDNMSRKK